MVNMTTDKAKQPQAPGTGLQFTTEQERAFWDSACANAGPQAADSALMGRRLRSSTLKPAVRAIPGGVHGDMARELGWWEAAQLLRTDDTVKCTTCHKRLDDLQDQRAACGNASAAEIVRLRATLAKT